MVLITAFFLVIEAGLSSVVQPPFLMSSLTMMVMVVSLALIREASMCVMMIDCVTEKALLFQ